MRFKKLIAAGGAFLLVVGASTLGAAAAYADDAPAPDTTVVETVPEPVVEPAPEPVVETVPEPVVEPAPEPATEPVVEPTTDPVESDAPSTESDSDPPSSSSDSSGSDFSVTTPSTFTRSFSTLKGGFAATKPGGDPLLCTDLTAGESGWTAKVDTVGDPATVNYTAPAGFLIDKYCVKAGTEPIIVFVNPPASSIVIDHPNKDSVSHWQVHLIAVTVVTPAAQGSDETCDEEENVIVGGSIQLTVITGVTYTITGPGAVNVPFSVGGLATGLAAGEYSVSFVLASGYSTSVVSPIVITIDEFDGDCVEVDVTPAAQASDQTCVRLITVEGSVQVTLIAGVTYTVTGPNGVVPLDVSGSTGPVPPGQYSVAFVLDAGYTTSVVSPILVTVNAFEGVCDLITSPPVIPAVTSSALSCFDLGSYTLSNDLGEAMAVEWTVNGNPLGIPLSSPSQFSVTSPGVYNIHAEPNDPDYGFTQGTQTDWTLTFVDAEDCDLSTLALTGQSPTAFIGGAMVLILTGLALFRMRTARRERMNLI